MAKSGGSVFLKILKTLTTLILSFIFLISAFAIPFYYSAVGIFTPKTVATVVQNIDYVEIIEKSPEFDAAMKELGIDINVANEIMQSKAIGDLIDNCAGTVLDVVIKDPKNIQSFDPLVMKDIINKHIDEITVVLNDNLDEPIKKEDVQSTMNRLLEENSDAIKETLADLAPDNGTITPYQKIMSIINTTLSWPFILAVILIEILFLGLIYLLNKNKFSGFIWIAVDSGIVAFLLTVALVIFNSNFITNSLAHFPNFTSNVVITIIGTITTKLIIALSVLTFIFIASIISVILFRKLSAKKAFATALNANTEDKAISEIEQEVNDNDEEQITESDELTE